MFLHSETPSVLPGVMVQEVGFEQGLKNARNLYPKEAEGSEGYEIGKGYREHVIPQSLTHVGWATCDSSSSGHFFA